MTPPTDLADWATDQTNNTPPSSGQKATGWTSGQNAVSSYMNWWKYAVHLWVVFLNSLFDAFGNMTLPGNLTVGGQPLAFTNFVYTADSTTDQLAATANGLETGDGPMHVSSTNAFPGGLGFGTDYYWIKVDADHGKLATSRANAIAGTFIDITSNGTGTQTLIHQSGTTRVTDATVTRNLTVGGNLSVGGTLTIVGDFKHGNRTRTIPGCAAPPTTNWTVVSGHLSSTGSGNATIAIPLMVGDRLKSVSFVMEGNGTVDMQADVEKQISMVSADTSVGSNSQNDVPASDVPMTVTVTSPVVNAGEAMYLNVFANASGLTVGKISYVYDHL